MNPFKQRSRVTVEGVKDSSMEAISGYTVLTADSLEQAQALAKQCPFLDIGGEIEVVELVAMRNQ